MEGFLFIDKQDGPTSHDVVDAVRRLTGLRQVGHAGTLDPFATGLLIIGVGNATKEMQKLVGLDKKYEAVLKLGATSDTYDRTGKIKISDCRLQIADLDIGEALEKFTGVIEQVPPMYSAKKVGGKKLYELARKGIEVKRKPKKITIYKIETLDFNPTTLILQLRIHCSTGTYIRSIAHDIGQMLGCGAYLKELRRIAIGPFRIEKAVTLDKLSKENLPQYILPASDMPDLHSKSEI